MMSVLLAAAIVAALLATGATAVRLWLPRWTRLTGAELEDVSSCSDGQGCGVMGLLAMVKQTLARPEPLERLPYHVNRLIETDASYAGLNVERPGWLGWDWKGLVLTHEGGQLHFRFDLPGKQKSHREAVIRGIFETIGVEPAVDYVPNNGRGGSLRILAYSLNGNTPQAPDLCRRILSEAFNVRCGARLYFDYSEHTALPRPKQEQPEVVLAASEGPADGEA